MSQSWVGKASCVMSRAFVGRAAVFGIVLAQAAWGAEPVAGKPLVPEDLARGKPAQASSNQGGDHLPTSANDGDPNSRWCASDASAPQWWQVDLGKPEDLTGCRLLWEFDGDDYRYKVEGSGDGKTWRTLVDESNATDRSQERSHKFEGSGIRYVRLSVSGLEKGHWASLFDIEVFGKKLVAGNPRPSRPRTVAGKGVLSGVKVPPGFAVTLFAAPPQVHYPTCLVAAPSGELFVGIDENGSLDAKAKRGRVVHCVDADADGVADHFKVFAEMDSPRGLVYDAGTLYVLHPPFLSAYHDEDGDGVSDRSEVLVKGVGFDLKFRGADHTTNGIQLGIDGWLYIAVGDYGFVKAEGRDGSTLQLRGGGIARVRTDGSRLELFARGTRNIYDVAIDPLGNVFTRDNTNDGGGWNVRLSHIIPTGNYGYPSLFTNFAEEIVAPLADYGGGSPCGSLFVQEPGLPAEYGNALYTCDWGRSIVYRHPLTANGAGFKAQQEPFVELPRPTDMDIDGRGNLYISTWSEGGFNYSGPSVGYVVRLSYEKANRPPFPYLKTATDARLLEHLASESHVLRLHAQREILRRGPNASLLTGLGALAHDKARPLAVRVAALFTIAQIPGDPAQNALLRSDADLTEFALKALAERDDATTIPVETFVAGLHNADPRVRLQAVVGLSRIGKSDTEASLVPLSADADPLVAHAAVKALVTLRAIDACFAGLDSGKPRVVMGCALALQSIHDPRVVSGLIARLNPPSKAHVVLKALGGCFPGLKSGTPRLLVGCALAFQSVRYPRVASGLLTPLNASAAETRREPILKALCRLYFQEGEWTGAWWGTRPDTSGPYFGPVTWSESDAIGQALRQTLAEANSDTKRWLLVEMIRNKIEFEEMVPLILKTAADDPKFLRLAVDLLAGRPKLAEESIRLLATVAQSEKEDPSLRARVLRGLQRHANQPEALEAAVHSFAAIGNMDNPDPELLGAWQEFARDEQHARRMSYFLKAAADCDPGRAALGYATLIEIEKHRRTSERQKREVRDALEQARKQPASTAAWLRAVGLLRDARAAAEVRSLLSSSDAAIQSAARYAARELNLDRAPSQGPLLAKMPFDEIVSGVLKDKGDVPLGAQLFQRQGCINCHTISPIETLKGPLLAGISARYNRKELTESILKPSSKIAQGFETQKFATTDGRSFDGFVVRESGDEVEFRNGQGAVTVLKKKDIEERGKSDVSIMPNGLGDTLTIHDLASIMAYLESLKAK